MPGHKILFADDDPDDRFLMLSAAKKAGIHDDMVAVTDGAEAVAWLEAEARNREKCRVRLAVLDLSMPRMTGHETLAWIRGSPRWSTLPVFILTASSHKGDALKAYSLGANGFMIKPTTIEELFDLVAGLNSFWLRFVVSPPDCA